MKLENDESGGDWRSMGLATYLGLRRIHWQHPMDGVEAKNRKTIAFYRE